MTDIDIMRREYRGGIIYSNSRYSFNYEMKLHQRATRRTYYKLLKESNERNQFHS